MERKRGWYPTVRQFLTARDAIGWHGWGGMGREALVCVEECVLELAKLRIRTRAIGEEHLVGRVSLDRLGKVLDSAFEVAVLKSCVASRLRHRLRILDTVPHRVVGGLV